jgi:Kef-type K+ transport system membrane component KefB
LAPQTRLRFSLAYAALVLVPLVGVVLVVRAGSSLPLPLLDNPAARTAAPPPAVTTLRLPILLMQIVVIIVVSRLVGAAIRRVRQPQVVGEMLAGVLLGPSVLGWLAPGIYAVVFPPGTLRFLNALSQIGLLLFMFLVGLELDPVVLRERRRTALLTSHASIAAPMFLGALVALLVYRPLGGAGVAFLPFALFLGAAMSVTAFPVLARILTEHRLQNTRLGTLAIACAAVGDVTAWCILAVVVEIARDEATAIPLWATIGGAALFLAVMLGVARPLFRALLRRFERHPTLPHDLIAGVVVVILASAWITERRGVHALFGAFIAGVAMPKHQPFVTGLFQRFEDLMLVLLLPLFFAFTGLRTSIGLISGGTMWGLTLLVIGCAVLGKLGGSTLAARVTGIPWRESASIGALMNTRGLMELIILNIGLDIGVITPTLFAMLVLMALATTFMTTPLLVWLGATRAGRGLSESVGPG